MYPNTLFWDLDLYSLCMVVGVVLCMVLVRLQADWRGFPAKLQNLILLDAVVSVVLGYGSAVLFQAFYNFMQDGRFEIVNNTGSTFYGGLIGGTVIFAAVYFGAGHFLFPDGAHKRQFRTVLDMAAPCITVAHGFGRLGCLMAGCCHGRVTDAWYGIEMYIPGHAEKVKVIPVQLYEAIFLLALTAVLLWMFKKGKRHGMPVYMMTYSLWRFVAEYLRADDRGATVVDFLSPSQLISVLLLAGGLIFLSLDFYLAERAPKKAAAVAAEAAAEADDPTKGLAEGPADAPDEGADA